MPGPYEAILFDFDGVLVDSEPVHWECWSEILKPHGIPLDWDSYCQNCIGISDREMLETLCNQVTPVYDIDKLWPEYPRKREMFRERMLASDPFHPDVHELVRSLTGYKLAVVTSSGQKEVEPILRNAGLLDFFETVVYGGDVKRLKPAPDPYRLGVERLGVKKALAVEDSAAGIASATAAGLDVCRVVKQSEMTSEVRKHLSHRS